MEYVIVDIDGTLSIVGDRAKCLQQNPKNWDEFYDRCDEDKPNTKIVELVQALWYRHYDIVFCTGRRESVRAKTVKWLHEYNMGHINCVLGRRQTLLMRPDGDFRHDTKVKPELLEKVGIKLKDIAFVLEDRSSMVKKWRELGVTCLQVAEGDF